MPKGYNCVTELSESHLEECIPPQRLFSHQSPGARRGHDFLHLDHVIRAG